MHMEIFSVVQSDGNSFCGDVVFDSLIMVYSDGDAFKTKNKQANLLGLLL